MSRDLIEFALSLGHLLFGGLFLVLAYLLLNLSLCRAIEPLGILLIITEVVRLGRDVVTKACHGVELEPITLSTPELRWLLTRLKSSRFTKLGSCLRFGID